MTTASVYELTEPILKRLMRPGDYETDALAQSITHQERQAVHAAMSHLTPYQHEIISLRYLRGFDVQRAAQELLTSPSIVREREREAIAVLQAQLPARRHEIAQAPQVYFTAVPQSSVPSKHRRGGRSLSIKRAPIFAWLATHPDATGRAIHEQFGVSKPTAYRLRNEWLTQKDTSPIHQDVPSILAGSDPTPSPQPKRAWNGYRGGRKPGTEIVHRAPIFAWLTEHPFATLADIAAQLQCSQSTAYTRRKEWRARQQTPPPPALPTLSKDAVARPGERDEHIVLLTMPDLPVVARYTAIPASVPPHASVSAPGQRTWYDEQVFQAQAFCVVLAEQEQAALAYVATVQAYLAAARERVAEAEQIAAQWHSTIQAQGIAQSG